MRDALARSELLLCLVDVAQEFELFDEFLVRGNIHENRRSPTMLREKDGPPPALNLSHHASNVGAELR
jgi:hypothetical protein